MHSRLAGARGRVCRAAAIGLLLAASPPAFAQPLQDISGNLAANPSFEAADESGALPARWSGDRGVYARDAKVARTGKASLKYVNAKPDRYRLCTRRVPVQAGWKCRFSVWVKTRALAGQDSGATICMEWQDKNGKWMGGSYPGGVKGTADWTRVGGIARVPASAGAVTLVCYVRKGMTGTAWFDDVELVRVADPPIRSIVLSPVYRGWITRDGPAAARVRVRLNLRDHDLDPKKLTLLAHITRAKLSRTFAETQTKLEGAGPFDLALPVDKLTPGEYSLRVCLVGPDGKAVHVDRHALVRRPDDAEANVTIDAHRRVRIGGKPFFPIGMYWHTINAKDIRVYADSRFNCLMPYGSPTREQMDLAHEHGLKVIYSIKDFYAGSAHCPKSIRTPADEEPAVRKRIRQFRDHPALLAWYLNDELPQSYMNRLVAHRRWAEEEDPNHPTWVVLYQVRQVAAYLNTFDVIGTDPYPIGRHPASMAAEWTAETFRQVEGARPIWQVPQLHNWANYRRLVDPKRKYRSPTRDEVRSMAWQCICEGATGLVFYSWYDVKRNPDVPFDRQWAYLKEIAAEIDRFAPVLLSAEPAPKVEVRCEPGKPRWLHWLVRRRGETLYLFTVNNGDAAGRATVTLPKRIERIRVLGEKRTGRPTGRAFRDEWEKLQVRAYEIKISDE